MLLGTPRYPWLLHWTNIKPLLKLQVVHTKYKTYTHLQHSHVLSPLLSPSTHHTRRPAHRGLVGSNPCLNPTNPTRRWAKSCHSYHPTHPQSYENPTNPPGIDLSQPQDHAPMSKKQGGQQGKTQPATKYDNTGPTVTTNAIINTSHVPI